MSVSDQIQTLFVFDPMFDKYRLAFFLNPATNPGTEGDEWLYGTLSFLADDLQDSEQTHISATLRRGVDIIRRHVCFGNLELPPECTSHLAWDIWKKVVQIADYYFRVVELKFFASLVNTTVRVFWDIQHRVQIHDHDF